MTSRIYGSRHTIDGDKVREFFDARAARESNAVDAVMLQSSGSAISKDRDAHEKNKLLPAVADGSTIIEFGCGAGRIAKAYAKEGNRYLGIDFSQKLIEIARAEHQEVEGVHFQTGTVPDIDIPALVVPPPYDLIIISALLLYMNDGDISKLFGFMPDVASGASTIYIRETLSDTRERLTLKDHHSEELNCTYNAIYRTKDELVSLMRPTLLDRGFTFDICGAYAFPERMRNRIETAQRYFILSR